VPPLDAARPLLRHRVCLHRHSQRRGWQWLQFTADRSAPNTTKPGGYPPTDSDTLAIAVLVTIWCSGSDPSAHHSEQVSAQMA